jgi:uncharacterized protein YecE (DUF72 family)
MDGQTAAKILVGTASWTDPSLIESGRFYPPDARTPEARLRFYASQFPLVEIDSSYYGLPAERTARGWVERSPDGFTFDVKAYALFTQHPTLLASLPKDVRNALPAALVGQRRLYYRDVPPELRAELWRRFADALLPLDSAGKLGAVLFQFPPWFLPNHESRDYIAQLRHALPGYAPSVEFRNPLWLDEAHRTETFSLLREHSMAYVCVDEAQETAHSVPPIVAATAPLGIVRFHGRNAAAWAAQNVEVRDKYDYFYSEQELAGWTPRIAELAEQTSEVHVLMNNCVADKGVTNARDIARLLRATPALGKQVVPATGVYEEQPASEPPAQPRLL